LSEAETRGQVALPAPDFAPLNPGYPMQIQHLDTPARDISTACPPELTKRPRGKRGLAAH
jgi:hypothetical protein